MKTIDSIGSSTTQRHGSVAKTGEQIKLQNSANFSSNVSATGRPPESSLLTKQEACQMLGCHWQTLLYREKSGQIKSIRIGRRKYYAVGEIKALLKRKPIRNKPHYSKRVTQQHNALVLPKPTLWQRIKALFV